MSPDPVAYVGHARQCEKCRDTEALLALYHEDAELESPLVPVILACDRGVLRGRDAIRRFLEEGTRRPSGQNTAPPAQAPEWPNGFKVLKRYCLGHCA